MLPSTHVYLISARNPSVAQVIYLVLYCPLTTFQALVSNTDNAAAYWVDVEGPFLVTLGWLNFM